MRTKNKLILILLFTMIVSLAACGEKKSGQVDDDMPQKITVGTIRVANDKTLAQQLGFFEEYFKAKGIEVEFLFFDSGTAANVALSAGSIDFAGMGYTNAVVALSKDLDVELIWIHEVLGANEALVVKEGINSVKDLAGKKIATPFSSTSHLSLVKALEMNALEQNDVVLLDMNTDDIVAAWERGDLDAVYTWEPTLSKIKKTGKVLLDSEHMAAQGVTTVNIELAHKNFTKKYPELVAGYISQLAKAGAYYRDEPEKAYAEVAKALSITEEDAKLQMRGTTWLTREEQLSSDFLGTAGKYGKFHQVFEETAKFLKEQKKIDKLPTLEEINAFINSSYIEQSLKTDK